MNDLFTLQGRTALVTGGSRGIGRMIAAGLLAQGARVYISSRKADACNATAAELRKHGALRVAAGRRVDVSKAPARWPLPMASARPRSTSW